MLGMELDVIMFLLFVTYYYSIIVYACMMLSVYLWFLHVISFMPIQPTEQQTMASVPLKEILIALSSTLWHHYSYSISYIIVAIASSAQIPRQGHPTVRMESCSWLTSGYTAVSFTTIPPGWPKSWIQNVHSTVYFGLSLVPTVMLHQYASITILVTSTWWLSLAVNNFCFAKFENLQCTKFLPQIHFDIASCIPDSSMPSLNTIVLCADMNRVQHRISSFGFSHNQTVYSLFYPIVRFFLQKLQLK